MTISFANQTQCNTFTFNLMACCNPGVCVCAGQKPQFGPAGDDYAKPKQKPKPKAPVQAAPVPPGPCQRAPVEVKEEEGDSEWQVPKRHAKKQKQKNKGG